jgi:hypothetical protein
MIFWTCGVLREHPLASPLVRTASNALVPKMVLGPTGIIETEINWDGPISEEGKRLFAERKVALYFFGKIDYRDAFGNSWYTEFRLANGGECDPLMSNGSMAHAQEGNKAT